MSKRHFERFKSCADRENLLDAVQAAGLDRSLADAFLDTDMFTEEVWHSYGRMIHHFGIYEIPLFTFTLGVSPMDSSFKQGVGPQPIVVAGSADAQMFLEAFEQLYASLPEDVCAK